MNYLKAYKTRAFWSDPFIPKYDRYVQYYYDDNKVVAMELYHCNKWDPQCHVHHAIVACECISYDDNVIEPSIESLHETSLLFKCSFEIAGGTFKKVIHANFFTNSVNVFPSPTGLYHVCVNTLVFNEDPFSLLVIQGTYPKLTSPLVFYEWSDDSHILVHPSQLDIVSCMLPIVQKDESNNNNNSRVTLRTHLARFLNQYGTTSTLELYMMIANVLLQPYNTTSNEYQTTALNQFIPPIAMYINNSHEIKVNSQSSSCTSQPNAQLRCNSTGHSSTISWINSDVPWIQLHQKYVLFHESKMMRGSNGMYVNHDIISKPNCNAYITKNRVTSETKFMFKEKYNQSRKKQNYACQILPSTAASIDNLRVSQDIEFQEEHNNVRVPVRKQNNIMRTLTAAKKRIIMFLCNNNNKTV